MCNCGHAWYGRNGLLACNTYIQRILCPENSGSPPHSRLPFQRLVCLSANMCVVRAASFAACGRVCLKWRGMFVFLRGFTKSFISPLPQTRNPRCTLSLWPRANEACWIRRVLVGLIRSNCNLIRQLSSYCIKCASQTGLIGMHGCSRFIQLNHLMSHWGPRFMMQWCR